MTGFLARFRQSRRGIIKGAGALAAAVATPTIVRLRSAYAAYPDRPVKIVVANTPGGPSDLVGRIITAALDQSTGKTFIIENCGGAGGNIGMGYAAHAEPDGYTILLATNAYSVNYGLYKSLPFDPYKDFVAVSELATSPNTFTVKSELPAKTMKELIALSRANPDKYNCATPPIGTTAQLQFEVLKIRENCRSLRMWCSRAAAMPSRRCSPAPHSFLPVRWRLLSRTSRLAPCAAWRSAAKPAGPPCRTCPPWRRPATRISPSRSTAC